MKFAIRWILTGFILRGVYSETGIYSTVALFLITLTIEINKLKIINPNGGNK